VRPVGERVVVVTGGAGLLGRSLCEAVARDGAVAVVADIDGDGARAVAESVAERSPSGRVDALQLDITSAQSISQAIAELQNRYGRIHALVNSAYPRNARYGRKLEDVTYADFCENVSLHLGGYFLATRDFAVYFRSVGGGQVVNVASIYGVVAPRFDIYAGTSMTMPVEYAAIKSALIHLTRYMAKYFAGQGVRFNCISPGGIRDRQSEEFVRRYGSYAGSRGLLEASDVQGVLLFLLSDAALRMNGQNLVVDDGWSL
jgi:NAD(P)-dependent dehydrogenase (short-subunit alcohol dehydrogenase family)